MKSKLFLKIGIKINENVWTLFNQKRIAYFPGSCAYYQGSGKQNTKEEGIAIRQQSRKPLFPKLKSINRKVMASPIKKLIKSNEEETKSSDIRINRNLDEIFMWKPSESTPEVNERIAKAKIAAESKDIDEAIEQLKHLSSEEEKIKKIEKSRIKYIIGNLLILKNEFLEAEKELLEARNIGMIILGLAEYETAKITNLLAICCWKNGKIKKGEAFLTEALSIYRMEFQGDESIEVAKIKCNLSIIKKQLGNFEEAEKLLIEALQTQEKLLTVNNFEYALTLQELGILYGSTGNMEKAEKLFEKSLEIQLNSTNEAKNHPSAIARTFSHLAIAAEARFDYKKAENLLLKAKEILIETNGEYSDAVAVNEMNIAAVLIKQNEFQGAESHLKQAESIFLRIYSKNHLKIAQVYKLLGSLYLHEKHFSQAEEVLKNSLSLFETHENTAVDQFAILISLADLHENTLAFDRENECYGQALAIFKAKLMAPGIHANIVESLEKLASFYYKKQEYLISRDIYHELIQNIKAIYGEHHPKYKKAISILDEIDDSLGSDFNEGQNDDDSSFDSSFDQASEDSSAQNEIIVPVEDVEQSVSTSDESVEEEDKTQTTVQRVGVNISLSTATDDLPDIPDINTPTTQPSPIPTSTPLTSSKKIPIIDINPDNEDDSSVDDPNIYKLPVAPRVSNPKLAVTTKPVAAQTSFNSSYYLVGGVGLSLVGLGIWFFLSSKKRI